MTEPDPREFVRALFGRPAPADPQGDEPPAGRVASEGHVQRPPGPDSDEQMREFTRSLFGHPTTPERGTP